jgi:hypothetical protein
MTFIKPHPKCSLFHCDNSDHFQIESFNQVSIPPSQSHHEQFEQVNPKQFQNFNDNSELFPAFSSLLNRPVHIEKRTMKRQQFEPIETLLLPM